MSGYFLFTNFPFLLLPSDFFLFLKDTLQQAFFFFAALFGLHSMGIPLLGQICFCCANVFLYSLLFADLSSE
jgi:hypothetical protein